MLSGQASGTTQSARCVLEGLQSVISHEAVGQRCSAFEEDLTIEVAKLSQEMKSAEFLLFYLPCCLKVSHARLLFLHTLCCKVHIRSVRWFLEIDSLGSLFKERFRTPP